MKVQAEADKIMAKFETFTDGWRVLMLNHRTKDGGHNRPDYHAVKRISKNKDDYRECLIQLLSEKQQKGLPHRLYASLNARDINKAIRQFKFEQLEADYYDEEQRNQWYKDIKNRFTGALMSPRSRAETRFLIDIDANEGEDVTQALELLEEKTDIWGYYDTPNGQHIITQPFNPNETPGLEVKKDALILLHV